MSSYNFNGKMLTVNHYTGKVLGRVDRRHEFWIQRADGKEKRITTNHGDASVREGNEISLLVLANESDGIEANYKLFNHSTDESWRLQETIPMLNQVGKFSYKYTRAICAMIPVALSWGLYVTNELSLWQCFIIGILGSIVPVAILMIITEMYLIPKKQSKGVQPFLDREEATFKQLYAKRSAASCVPSGTPSAA